MDLISAKFYDRDTIDTSHPLHHTLLTHRNIRNTPSTDYTSILNTIPTAPSGISNSIHNTLATRSINGLCSNSVFEVNASEAELSREESGVPGSDADTTTPFCLTERG